MKPLLRVGIWQAVSTKAQMLETKREWEKQREDGEKWAEANGGRVVELFTVPGHSRRRYSLEKLAAEAEQKQITAFTQLLAHFDRPQMDVLWCRGGDRFARTQSLFARIVEELIDAGVAIYSQQDDLLIRTMKQARHWISTEGARAASDVDKLVEYRHNGMSEYMRRGLPTASTPPRSHTVRRNPVNGKAEALVANPETRPMYEDAARLLLEGVAYRRLEKELLTRFGHCRPDGKPYPVAHVWEIFTNPITWGNVARFHVRKHGDATARTGMASDWIFEPGHDLPEGVEIAYNVCEPLFKPDMAAEVKAEMRRRWLTAKGSGLRSSKRLSGLVVCDECRRPMAYAPSHGVHYLRCFTHWRHREGEAVPDCSQRRMIRESVLVEALSDALLQALHNQPDALFAAGQETSASGAGTVETLPRQLDDLTAQIRRLIDAQKTAGDDLFHDYQQQIAALGVRRKRVTEQLAAAQREQAKTHRSTEQAARLMDHLREVGIARFWQQPDREVNQALHALMQGTVILVRGGKIVDHERRS